MVHGVTPQQEDWLEKRFEGFVKSQNAMHKELHDKLLHAVETQIKTTVNGKIDRLTEQVTLLNEQIKPVNTTKKWFSDTKQGATWLAGFLTPWVIIGSAIIYITKLFK